MLPYLRSQTWTTNPAAVPRSPCLSQKSDKDSSTDCHTITLCIHNNARLLHIGWLLTLSWAKRFLNNTMHTVMPKSRTFVSKDSFLCANFFFRVAATVYDGFDCAATTPHPILFHYANKSSLCFSSSPSILAQASTTALSLLHDPPLGHPALSDPYAPTQPICHPVAQLTKHSCACVSVTTPPPFASSPRSPRRSPLHLASSATDTESAPSSRSSIRSSPNDASDSRPPFQTLCVASYAQSSKWTPGHLECNAPTATAHVLAVAVVEVQDRQAMDTLPRGTVTRFSNAPEDEGDAAEDANGHCK